MQDPLSGVDILAKICADTRVAVAKRREATDIAQMRRLARAASKPRGFGAALKAATVQGGYGLVAEIKRASPSGGIIRADFNPTSIAQAYEAGGAACLSVLTEEPHFGGDAEHLRAARAGTTLPVLRKDFILDPWQVFESRAMDADCILLIMAALTDAEATELEQLARELDMDVLVEAHDAAELARALHLQTSLIGINNRDLKTLQTDLQTTVTLASHVPPERFLISESGIRTHGDVERLAGTGTRSFLVGESLLRQADLTQAVQTLLGRTAT